MTRCKHLDSYMLVAKIVALDTKKKSTLSSDFLWQHGEIYLATYLPGSHPRAIRFSNSPPGAAPVGLAASGRHARGRIGPSIALHT